MRTAVFRVFSIAFVFMLCINLIRACYGDVPIFSFSSLLNALSELDFSFSYTYSTIAETAEIFQDISIGGIDFLIDIGKAIYNIIRMPIMLLRDLLITVGSVLSFIARLVGFWF